MSWLKKISFYFSLKNTAFVLTVLLRRGSEFLIYFHAVLAVEQQRGANTSFETWESFMFGMLRGRKTEQTDRFVPSSRASTPHWSGNEVPHQYGCWANCIFPHRHEFAWKWLLCDGRTLLNISPRELYLTWEFALWAVSLSDRGSEIPPRERTCLESSGSGITGITLQQILSVSPVVCVNVNAGVVRGLWGWKAA